MLQSMIFPYHIVLQVSYLNHYSNSHIQGFRDHPPEMYSFAVHVIGYAQNCIINLFLYLSTSLNQTLLIVIKMYCVRIL